MSMKKKLKKVIKKLSSQNYLFRSIYNKIKSLKRKIMYKRMYKKIPVNDKMIIFETFWGKSYACSPKAIYEYMVKQPEYADYQFIWVFKDPKKRKHLFTDERTKFVKYDTKKYYRYFAEAKYWIVNFRLADCIIKKDNQVCLQCWHGTPLKRIGCDIEIEKGNKLSSKKAISKSYIGDAKKYNYFISPSRFCTEKFTTSFGLDQLHKEDILIETGYPRNDFLYTYTQEDVKQIKEKLNIPEEKKVILYAPTFRDNQHQLGKGYVLSLQLDLDNLQRKLGDEYVVLMRLHYLVASKLDIKQYEGFIYDVSKYDDINDLYIIADMLITDYSSVFFDYANLRRPILFYMYDLEEYQHNIRNFYIDLNELPGPIVQTEKDLLQEINTIGTYQERYKDAYQKFHDKYNYLDDGNAAKRVAKVVIEGKKLEEVQKQSAASV